MYNCVVLYNPNVGKFGKGTWVKAKKKKKNLAHDPGITPQLVQIHDMRPRAEVNAWDTKPSTCPKRIYLVYDLGLEKKKMRENIQCT